MPDGYTLKYLFKVEFDDGTFFHQKPSDVSDFNPQKSQYTDLLAVGKMMRRAWLTEHYQELGNEAIMVDLLDGHFEVNGLWVQFDQNPLPPMIRELVFFREHQHDSQNTYSQETGKLIEAVPGEHRIKYFIGWRVTVNNKSFQQVIGVK
jgi:hypothetical protein